ncbi:MAG: hypothetical protein CM1200mP12_02370 [Gammaproteobacteria bacterium]|nr:MAG: hypothetical protein CM1200mP12_02370 [Gammaproteobacteria bacterium]
MDLANVAAGRLGGFWGSGLEDWDIAAGGLLVQEAGGLVSNYFGEPEYREGGIFSHLLQNALSQC